MGSSICPEGSADGLVQQRRDDWLVSGGARVLVDEAVEPLPARDRAALWDWLRLGRAEAQHFIHLPVTAAISQDAFQREDEVQGHETETRPCFQCGINFRPARFWQKQCSPRCRQRTYVQRRPESPVGYHGA